MTSVVILHYQFWPELRLALDAVLQQVSAENVVIVDNASADGSAAAIREAYPQCRLIEAAENRGYGAGMNLGIRYTTGDVLLLTHECVLAPAALSCLERRLRECPDVGIVGPLLTNATVPGAVHSAGGVIGPRWRQSHLFEPEPFTDGVGAVDCDWLDGACLLIRRAVLDRRRFDEGYFLYFEETEFCVRSRRDHWRIECVQAARATQATGPGEAAIALWTRNRLRFLWRNARAEFATELPATVYRALHALQSSSGWLMLRGIASLATREDPVQLFAARSVAPRLRRGRRTSALRSGLAKRRNR